jgi:D-tyrosyl-tRNA(Tyr) deacylase
MRILVQRVTRASVEIAGETVGKIGAGLLLLVGVHEDDGEADADFCADKCCALRIFTDEAGKFNLSAGDVHAEMLVVSQFTLYGDCRKGRRPSFVKAARPEKAEPLVARIAARIEAQGFPVAHGRFGANMQVSLCNDGPVTVLVESPSRRDNT